MGTFDQQASGRGGPRLSRSALSSRSRAARHRRRRWAAAVSLGVIVLLGLIVAHGNGTLPHRSAPIRPALHRAAVLPSAAAQGALEQIRETAAIDRTLARTPYVRIAGAQHREIALTFDDGPGPYTPAILSELQQARAPATFFEVGVLERYFHDATASIVAASDVIGDHTQAHAPMSRLSVSDQRAQLLQQTSATGLYGAPFPRLFRPPYGLWNAQTLKLLHQFRMLMVLWSVDTADYRLPGVAAIVDSAVNGARPGAIILLHDAGGNRAETVAAVPLIVRALRARGYKLVTVPKLLLDNPAPANQNVAGLIGGGQ